VAFGESRLAPVVSDGDRSESRGDGDEAELDRALARGDFATVRRMSADAQHPEIAAMVAPERAFLIVGVVCALVISAMFGYYVVAS
jgi:hypothetical protein